MALCTGLSSSSTRFPLGDRSVSTISTARSTACSCVYLDAMNIMVGGAQVSAARNRQAPSPAAAAARGICDPAWRLDFAQLLSLMLGSDPNADHRAVCFGSNKRGNDGAFWNSPPRAGWVPIVLTRNCSGREKGVDVMMAVTVMEDLLQPDIDPSQFDVTLLTGDQDLVPVIAALSKRGFGVDVGAWAHTASPEIVRSARRFFALDPHFDLLTFQPQRH